MTHQERIERELKKEQINLEMKIIIENLNLCTEKQKIGFDRIFVSLEAVRNGSYDTRISAINLIARTLDSNDKKLNL